MCVERIQSVCVWGGGGGVCVRAGSYVRACMCVCECVCVCVCLSLSECERDGGGGRGGGGEGKISSARDLQR